jgi:glycosyltransferase involved in cell wall biosynthesis
MTPDVAVAVAGMRGVPANFGGSETATEQIGERLARGGTSVTVYCRRHNSTTTARTYKGMRRILLPSIKRFQLDTISHSALATLHFRLLSRADVIHYTGMGNGLVLPLLWGSRKRAVVTIDGPDWERPKWGRFARFALRASAFACIRWADEVIIDNHPSIDYFARHFGYDAVYIPYGADRTRPTQTDYLQTLGLEPDRYVLFVGALVPDKGPDILIDAYRQVDTNLPLVVVGDSPFVPEFGARVRQLAALDGRVRMPGYVRGESYRQLVSNARIYVHPLRSDGTSPALLQAMGFGRCIVVNSIPETLAAVGDAAVPFARDDTADLARKLTALLNDPQLIESYRSRAIEHARRQYDWDKVTADHLAVYRRAVERPRARWTAAVSRPPH